MVAMTDGKAAIRPSPLMDAEGPPAPVASMETRIVPGVQEPNGVG
jgi:hypothetical protein